MKIYDVAIIGSGPAGSMLVRLLQERSLKVAVFDVRPMGRDFKASDFKKSCGGLLAPDAQEFLKKHNISLTKEVLAGVQSKVVKTSDLDANLVRFYGRNYINIIREKFDRFLLKDIEFDAFFETRVHRIEEKKGAFIINDFVTAKIIVGADGANSVVRKLLFPKLNLKKYVCVQELFLDKFKEVFECFFAKGITDYYGWSFSKNGKDTMLGVALKIKEKPAEKYENFKALTGYDRGAFKEGGAIIRPRLFHPISCRKNVFLIGEAGGYISPSSAEGISFAFKTAEILAKSNFKVWRFKLKMLRICASIFLKNIKGFFMYNRVCRKIIMSYIPRITLTSRKNPVKGKIRAQNGK